jgi:hypothetical protein
MFFVGSASGGKSTLVNKLLDKGMTLKYTRNELNTFKYLPCRWQFLLIFTELARLFTSLN